MKVWYNGKYIEMNIGDRATVLRTSSGRSSFGEGATLTGTTASHLVFTTDSGATVKTKKDNIHDVVGRASKSGYCVSPHAPEGFEKMLHEEVRFWDSKSGTFVKK